MKKDVRSRRWLSNADNMACVGYTARLLSSQQLRLQLEKEWGEKTTVITSDKLAEV